MDEQEKKEIEEIKQNKKTKPQTSKGRYPPPQNTQSEEKGKEL